MSVEFIAEFCQNHNGDTVLLEEMIHAAADSGARVGKIQTIFADNLAYRPKFETGIEIEGRTEVIKRPYRPEYERMKGLELDFDAHARFVESCVAHGLDPMTTCFSREHVEAIRSAGFRRVKVASYDCASYPMLRDLAAEFDELVVSTGATFDDEIVTASRILSDVPHKLLHCVTIYPTPLDQVHLSRMRFLRTLCGCVGFSDHSLVQRDGMTAAKAACHEGAEVIERHFTILDAKETKDGPVSVGPGLVADLIRFAELDHEAQREELDARHPGWLQCLGDASRGLSAEELRNRDYYKGRFASRRERYGPEAMIYNWEETRLGDE
ncbi:MAG: general stress protein [Proteobacteria bacterium]|nr:MAG: general stress protein [Pseudomonadota bacterium]